MEKQDVIKKGMKDDYPLIPLMEIEEEARLLAVTWIENLLPDFAIEQKHKLASDFMNYARRVSSKEWVKIENKDDLPKKSGRYWVIDKYNNNEVAMADINLYGKYHDDIVTGSIDRFSHWQEVVKPSKPLY